MIKEEGIDTVKITLSEQGNEIEIGGEAFGALSAFIDALERHTDNKLRVLNYNEHALSVGTRAEAVAYVELDVNGKQFVGVATSQDTVGAMFRATLGALNAGLNASLIKSSEQKSRVLEEAV